MICLDLEKTVEERFNITFLENDGSAALFNSAPIEDARFLYFTHKYYISINECLSHLGGYQIVKKL